MRRRWWLEPVKHVEMRNLVCRDLEELYAPFQLAVARCRRGVRPGYHSGERRSCSWREINRASYLLILSRMGNFPDEDREFLHLHEWTFLSVGVADVGSCDTLATQ